MAHAGGDHVNLPGTQGGDQSGEGLVRQHHFHAQLVGDGLCQLHIEALQLLLAGFRIGIVKFIGRETHVGANHQRALLLDIGEHVRHGSLRHAQGHAQRQDQCQYLFHKVRPPCALKITA